MWLLLLAQLAQQPAKPAAPAAPSASAPAKPKPEPTQPTQPTVPQVGTTGVVEARTTQAEGTNVLPVDPRTTRDDQFDPRAAAQAADEQREAVARAQAVQRNAALTGTRIRVVDPAGNPVQHRPIEITTTASVVGGYNSNVIQTSDVLGGPVTKRAAMYNAVEGRVELEFWGRGEEPQAVSVQVLGQQYYKLDSGPSLPQDGSVLALYGGGFALGKSTRLGIRAFSSIQTLNSSRQQDGVLFQIDPANLQRTFTLSNLTFQIQHEITPTTRYIHLFGATMSTTLRDEPSLLADGSRLFHRGLDYVQFNTTGAVVHDFGSKVRGFFDVEYEGIYNNFFLDFTRQVPVRRGDFSQHLVRSNLGSTYIFSDALSATGRIGGAIATVPSLSQPAPPPDPNDPNALDANDRSAIVTPQGTAEILYQKPTFNAELIAGYTFGSVNPRIGFGRTFQVDAVIGGVPFPSDKVLRNVAILGTGTVSRAILRPTNEGDAFLSFIGATALVRYKLTSWLGALGGYSMRYVNFSGTLAAPDLMRHQVFFGLSGFFTTDTTEPPPLSVFAPPRPTG